MGCVLFFNPISFKEKWTHLPKRSNVVTTHLFPRSCLTADQAFRDVHTLFPLPIPPTSNACCLLSQFPTVSGRTGIAGKQRTRWVGGTEQPETKKREESPTAIGSHPLPAKVKSHSSNKPEAKVCFIISVTGILQGQKPTLNF